MRRDAIDTLGLTPDWTEEPYRLAGSRSSACRRERGDQRYNLTPRVNNFLTALRALERFGLGHVPMLCGRPARLNWTPSGKTLLTNTLNEVKVQYIHVAADT